MFTELLINAAIALFLIGCFIAAKKGVAGYRERAQLHIDLRNELSHLLGEYRNRVKNYKIRLELLFPHCSNYFISLPAAMHHEILKTRQELQEHIRRLKGLEQCLSGGIDDCASAIARLKLLLKRPVIELGSDSPQSGIVSAQTAAAALAVDTEWEDKLEAMIQTIGAELRIVLEQAGEFSPHSTATEYSLEESLTMAGIQKAGDRRRGNS